MEFIQTQKFLRHSEGFLYKLHFNVLQINIYKLWYFE